MKVFALVYTDCIYESAFGVVNLHKTKMGALKAYRKFILDKYKKWDVDRRKYGFECECDRSINWGMERLRIWTYDVVD